MSTATAEDNDQELPDATGFAGTACTVSRPEGETVPGIVKGSYRPAEETHPDTVRVLVAVEDSEQLLDTDSSRVEVF